MDKRLEKNKENVIKLKNFLIEINKSPQTILVEIPNILEVLKNQGTLSKYHDDKRNIIPSSLNTLKRISERFFENGFEELDSLRDLAIKTIYKELNKKIVINKVNKADLKNTIKENTVKQDELKSIHLTLMNQVMEDLSAFNKIISSNDLELIKEISKKAKNRIQSLGSKSSELVDLASSDIKSLKIVK